MQSDCLRDQTETTPKSSIHSYLHEGPKHRTMKADDEDIGFEVLTLVVMKSLIFRDITPCRPLEVNGRLGGGCRKKICFLPSSS